MQQRGLKHLSGGFGAQHIGSRLLNGLIFDGKVGVGFIFFAAVQHHRDQAIGFNFCGSRKREIGFHRDI